MSWRTDAEKALDELIASGVLFTPDDVWEKVGWPDPTHAANSSNNAMGALFRDYSSRKKIEAVGTTRSTQPHRKKGMVRVWRGK